MSLHEDGLARPLKKVAINRSVSTNGTEVSVTKNETSAQNAGTETLLLWQTKTSIAIWREKMKMDVT